MASPPQPSAPDAPFYNPDDPNVPVDTRDLLFIGTFGKVAALHKHTGQQIWKNSMKGCGYGIPDMVYDPVGMLLAANGGKLLALQPQTGAELWRNGVPGYNLHSVVIPQNQEFPPRPPRVTHPRNTFPAGQPPNAASAASQSGLYDKLGDPIVTNTPMNNVADGNVAQTPDRISQPPSPMVFVGGHGKVVGIDKRTGQEIWKTGLPGTGWMSVEILEEDGLLFAASMGHVFALHPSTGSIVWRNDLPGMGHTFIQLATVRSKSLGGTTRYANQEQGRANHNH